ncbi:hypothetical protein SmJEL517_g00611 [Synchytrium microbalum]|uniref:Enoyl reductase (ER) domain-containing protein n=1 Tax=Synchytrium microbalum TaxID=1806994 RepID=A0A507C7J7_9FUNG|nr:uncharacterized protein SmJEL517_g00611 [Synchytrium microbalum]TPX37550.1 hypothetical protein SmJEL517_g00611 [Synchytrium microbalum]
MDPLFSDKAQAPSTTLISPQIYRGLNDKLYEKRKSAALDVERLVRDYLATNDHARIRSLIRLLIQDFAYSPIPNSRNGGLIALAAIGIALGPEWVVQYLDFIVPPILNCTTDQDSRVRYYACESMYNVAKMARGEVLKYFNELFDALSKLSADSEVSVKNGAELLDRLLKDIVCEQAVYYHPIQAQIAAIAAASSIPSKPPASPHQPPSRPSPSNVPESVLPSERMTVPAVPGSSPQLPGTKASEFNLPRFIPLLVERIKTLNPFSRMFLVQWIGVLDSVPDLELIAYLPEFLDGLFGYLSDPNPDIRSATLNVLGEFLKEIRDVVEVQRDYGVVHFRGKDGVTFANGGTIVTSSTTSESTNVLSPSQHDVKQSPSDGTLMSPPVVMVSATSTNTTADGHFFIDPTRDGSLPYRLGQSVILDFGRMVDILQPYLSSNDESTHATALLWMSEFIVLARELMLPYTPTLLSTILKSLPNSSPTIRSISVEANANLYRLVINHTKSQPTGAPKEPGIPYSLPYEAAPSTTSQPIDRSKSPELVDRSVTSLSPTPRVEGDDSVEGVAVSKLNQMDFEATVHQLTAQLSDEHDETRIATIDWLLMLHRKAPLRVLAPCDETFTILFRALSDRSEEVVKRDLSLIAQISMHLDDASLSKLLSNLLSLFSSDRRLLEQRGALITRHLCLTLHPERIFRLYAEILEREEDLDFASTMVQSLNIILITAPELIDLRRRLKNLDHKDGSALFTALYRSWAHNAVATFALCLLSGCYDHAYTLISSFADLEITVTLLVQIDRLVQLLESPVFTGLRLQLLEPDKHPALYKCLYGILMLLPQSSAFHTLRKRLNSMSGLMTMYGPGAATSIAAKSPLLPARPKSSDVSPRWNDLMAYFVQVQTQHEKARRTGVRSTSQEKSRRSGNRSMDDVGTMDQVDSTPAKPSSRERPSKPATGDSGIRSSAGTSSSFSSARKLPLPTTRTGTVIMATQTVLLLKQAPAPPKGQLKYDRLEVSKIPIPVPKSNEVLLKISAAALNHRDVFIRQGLYPGVKYDSVLGSDGVGTVVSSPSDASLVGKRVVLNPSQNWASDPRAPENPAAYGMLGLLPFAGTLGEYMVIDKRYVHICPAHLTDPEAAALPLAALTAFRATFTKAQVKAGQNVLVTGAGGGVALYIMQFCLSAGARVVVTSSDDTKIEKAVKLGAAGGVNYKKKDWIAELTKLSGKGFDCVIDGAGGSDNYKAFVRVLKAGGIIAAYGATAESAANLIIPQIFLKHIELKGSTMGNEVEFADMIKFVSKHQIHPIVSGVFSFEEAEKAFDEMKKGAQFGKLVVQISSKM